MTWYVSFKLNLYQFIKTFTNIKSRFRHNTVYVAIHVIAYTLILSAILSWIVVAVGIGYGAFAPTNLNFGRLLYFIFQGIILSGGAAFFYECAKHIKWKRKSTSLDVNINDPNINHMRQMVYDRNKAQMGNDFDIDKENTTNTSANLS